MAFSIFGSVLILVSVVTPPAMATSAPGSSSLLESKLHSIVRSKTKAQLIETIDQHEEIGRLRKECEELLAAKKIPIACFAALKKEREAGLIAPTSKNPDTKWLEQVCIRRATEASDLEILRFAATSEILPQDCRRSIESRKLDVEYTAEVENPVMLFRQRLPKSPAPD